MHLYLYVLDLELSLSSQRADNSIVVVLATLDGVAVAKEEETTPEQLQKG